MAKGFSVYVEIAGTVGSSFTAAVDAAESRIKKLSSVVKAPTMIAPPGFAGSLLTAETKLKSLAEAAGKSAIDARKHFDGLAESVKGVVGILVAHNAAHLAFRAGERYREYDKERRYGKAVMGITDEQQEPLVRQAIKGGATSKYNDIQWLEAQRELAARGLNVNQVLALTGVSSTIGQAMDRSLPEASKALEGGMFGFGKDTSTYDSALANAKRTADLQVKASKISGMSYDDILESYKFAATPFKLAGLSEEQMLAFAGVGKKANMPGAEMGTAGRALVANLLKPTAGARTAMMANGIDFSKYQTQGTKPMDAESFSKSIAASYGVELDKGTKQALQKTFNDKSIVGDSAKFMPAIMSVLGDHLGGDDAKSKKSIAGEARRYRDASMSGVDAPRLFNDLMGAMAKNPTLANAIFGAKQGGRVMSALGDPGVFRGKLDELQNHSQGYAQSVSDARMAGFDGALSMLSGSIANFDTALGRAFDGDGKGGFLTTATLAIKRLVDVLVDANPAVLRFGAILAGAFATSAIVRFANTVFGFTSMARSITYLSMSATYGLAARLIGISRAIVTFTAASSAATAVRAFATSTAALALAAPAALAVRLRATAAGVMALYAAGGARGVLVGLAGSIVGLGRAVVLFPLLQLRAFGAALVAMPLVRLRATVAGIMALQAVGGTGAVFSALAASLASFGGMILRFPWMAIRNIGMALFGLANLDPEVLAVTAIVGALVALGVWVYNNWSGIVSFFGAFGSAFMGALGPGASGAIEKVVGWLGAAWRWVSNLLGPIDATGERWKAWGASAGAAAAAVVNGLLYLPTEIAKIAKAMWDSLVNFDWVAAGASIAGAVGRGLGGLVMAPVNLVKRGLGFGGITAPAGTPVAGARAAGGPVGRGLPYLVGENGPEIFVPGASGQISTNGALRRLASARGTGDEDGGNVETVRALRGMSFALAGSLDGLARAINRLDASGEKGGTDDVGGAGGGGLGGGFSGGRRGFMARAGHFGGRRGFMKNGVATADYGTPSKSLLDFIAKSEGTRGYDTSLGFGKFLPGHQETDLQGKSLKDILDLGRYMRQQPGNPNSSALGRYQFTGETIRDLMGRMHLSGAEKFDGPMQDAMASRLIQDEGPRALGRWASLRGGKMDTALGLLKSGQVAPMPTDAGSAATAGKLVADNGRSVALPNGESGGHMRGKLALDGKAYDFGSGGNRGANSIPMGDYEVTPDAVGAWGKANGALGIANGHIWDKTLGRMREGIELHAAHSANMISSGCLAFAKGQFDEVKGHVLKMVREKGHAYLHVGSNGASITSTKAPPSAMAAAPEKKDAGPKTAMVAPDKPPVDAVAPVKVAGARAMGGSVGAGLSYLVGERGPEIFSPGASGQISTNGTLSRLTDIGRRVIEGSGEKIAPEAGRVAAARPGPAGSGAGSAGGRGGDTTYHAGEHHWNIKASDPKGVREEVERTMMGIIAQFESTQRGSLSD